MSSAPNQFIDSLILSTVVKQWRKVALIVGKVHTAGLNNAVEISDDAIADRIRALVDEGKLEAQGNLDRWRHSEVRLPDGAGQEP